MPEWEAYVHFTQVVVAVADKNAFSVQDGLVAGVIDEGRVVFKSAGDTHWQFPGGGQRASQQIRERVPAFLTG
jgi:hypothetical protein